MDISRLDAGVLHADKAPFAVSTLLDALAEEYRQVAGVRGLTLHYVPSRVWVESDLALLARVVRNFLSNAVRYTEHGHLLLGCRRRPMAWRLWWVILAPVFQSPSAKPFFWSFVAPASHRPTTVAAWGWV